jgi:hypothetical protein
MAYRSRIRLILPHVSVAHPELVLLANLFRQDKARKATRVKD